MAQQFKTVLTKHKQPRLAKLLEAAKTCEPAALKRYLQAGGSPNAVVDMQCHQPCRVPLLMAVVQSHRLKQCRGCMEILILVEAGAAVDAIGFCADDSAESALIWAAAQS
jgi:hypothetical protein